MDYLALVNQQRRDHPNGPPLSTPEERQARAEAFARWMVEDQATPDTDPPGTSEAILRALNRKYRYTEPRRGPQQWLRDFFWMRDSSGWPARTRKIRKSSPSAPGC